MIGLLEFKELLGEEAASLTDVQVERIRDLEYQIADALFENWLRQHSLASKIDLEKKTISLYNERVHNNPVGFFVPETSGAERG
jgi:hypothetical protein